MCPPTATRQRAGSAVDVAGDGRCRAARRRCRRSRSCGGATSEGSNGSRCRSVGGGDRRSTCSRSTRTGQRCVVGRLLARRHRCRRHGRPRWRTSPRSGNECTMISVAVDAPATDIDVPSRHVEQCRSLCSDRDRGCRPLHADSPRRAEGSEIPCCRGPGHRGPSLRRSVHKTSARAKWSSIWSIERENGRPSAHRRTRQHEQHEYGEQVSEPTPTARGALDTGFVSRLDRQPRRSRWSHKHCWHWRYGQRSRQQRWQSPEFGIQRAIDQRTELAERPNSRHHPGSRRARQTFDRTRLALPITHRRVGCRRHRPGDDCSGSAAGAGASSLSFRAQPAHRAALGRDAGESRRLADAAGGPRPFAGRGSRNAGRA